MSEASPEQQEVLRGKAKQILDIMQNFFSTMATLRAKRKEVHRKYSAALAQKKAERLLKEMQQK